MIRSLLLSLALVFMLALPACAASKQGGFAGPGSDPGGGFKGPGPALVTVEQAMSMADDSRVTLRGHIERSLGGDEYLFRDASGTIQVDIDRKRWQGQTITPTDLVEIQGKVDKDFMSLEIDVKRISKVGK